MTYIKKPEETKLIAEGGKLMGEILENLAKLLKPGVSAWEIDMEAERMIRAVGGIPAFKGYRGRKSDPPFPSTVCFSRNEELVHGIAAKDKIVKDGDIVTIDIGMQYPRESGIVNHESGFFTDTAVTVVLGKQSPEVLKLLEVTKEALEVGIRAAQPGATVASIGKAIEQYVKSQGKYGIVRDLVGHGVGHAVHEEPRVPNFYDKALENWVLEPGVVIAIEPMITLGSAEVETADDGWTITPVDRSLNAHFEHTLIITKDGNEVVTRRQSEL
ncbi:MAG: type I methionyl aminopeptidase [Candidatus Magasanikbacteria bacterium]|nr:type I methionyl aminopeptidase [Candidatus Magasanikbacteria bacterium]